MVQRCRESFARGWSSRSRTETSFGAGGEERVPVRVFALLALRVVRPHRPSVVCTGTLGGQRLACGHEVRDLCCRSWRRGRPVGPASTDPGSCRECGPVHEEQSHWSLTMPATETNWKVGPSTERGCGGRLERRLHLLRVREDLGLRAPPPTARPASRSGCRCRR
jgi:hypothetical protein